MTAKEYLRQIRLLDLKIQHRMEEKKTLMSMASGVSAVSGSPDKVQTSGSTEGPMRYADKYMDMEKEIATLIDKYIDLRNLVISQIHQLEDARYVEVLHQRYVNCYSFELIAVNMHYSIRRIYQLHSDALQEFSKKHSILFHDLV